MIIHYTLDKQDFLNYQLFVAAQIPKIKKIRRKKRLTFPILFVLFGFIFLTISKASFALISWSLALIWYSIFPLIHKHKYQKLYTDFVEKNYGQRFGQEVSLDIREDKIIGKDNGFEIKVNFKEIEEIIDIPGLILIKISEQQQMLIAKSKIEDLKPLAELLKSLCERWEVPLKIVLQ